MSTVIRKTILSCLVMFSASSVLAEDITVKSFSKFSDCENLEIIYRVVNREIEVNFLDTYQVESTGVLEKRTCLLQFEVVDTSGTAPLFSYAFEVRAHTSSEIQGKIASTFKRLGDVEPIDVVNIPENTCMEIDTPVVRPPILAEYQEEFTMELRVDLSLFSSPTTESENSYIKMYKASLSL